MFHETSTSGIKRTYNQVSQMLVYDQIERFLSFTLPSAFSNGDSWNTDLHEAVAAFSTDFHTNKTFMA